MGLADVSFLVVGLLAAKLAERQLHSDVNWLAATRFTRGSPRFARTHRRIDSFGLITTDLEGQIYTFNAAAEEITGYTAQEVSGKNASMFFGDITRQTAVSMEAAASGKSAPLSKLIVDPERFHAAPRFQHCTVVSRIRARRTCLWITFQDLTDVRDGGDSAPEDRRGSGRSRIDCYEIRNPLAHARIHSDAAFRNERGFRSRAADGDHSSRIRSI
jgi:two-component system sensor histidine kinase PilS (NtrC family)